MRSKNLAIFFVSMALFACGGGDEGSPSAETDIPATERGTSDATPEPGSELYESFGREAGGRERAAILQAVRRYAQAIVRDDWSQACAMQSRQSAQVYRQENQQSCEDLFANAIEKVPEYREYRRSLARPNVTRVHLDGSEALAFLKLDGGRTLKWAFAREAGGWKVGAALFD